MAAHVEVDRPSEDDMEHPQLAVGVPELTVVTAEDLYPHLTELSPTLVGVVTKPDVVRLRRPLREISVWKDSHQLFVAGMVGIVYKALDEAGLPHIPAEVAEEAHAVHDNGFADNVHIEDPQVVNAPRKLTKIEFDQVGTHAGVGALRVSDPRLSALVSNHDSYVTSAAPDERRRLLSDPVSVSTLVLQGSDIAEAVTSIYRPYRRRKNRFGPDDRTRDTFTVDETRHELSAQVPLLPERVRERIIDAVNVVFSAPVRAEIHNLARV